MSTKLYKLAIVQLTHKQFEQIDSSDMDYNYTELRTAKSTLFSKWHYEHGLNRSQKAVLAKFKKAVDNGAEYVLFTK